MTISRIGAHTKNRNSAGDFVRKKNGFLISLSGKLRSVAFEGITHGSHWTHAVSSEEHISHKILQNGENLNM